VSFYRAYIDSYVLFLAPCVELALKFQLSQDEMLGINRSPIHKKIGVSGY